MIDFIKIKSESPKGFKEFLNYLVRQKVIAKKSLPPLYANPELITRQIPGINEKLGYFFLRYRVYLVPFKSAGAKPRSYEERFALLEKQIEPEDELVINEQLKLINN